MQKLQLFIPEPCHENWDNMSPTQQGRFCNSCAKEVIDFSSMTDAQVLNYFNVNTSSKVCGRAYPDQLERTIEMPLKPKGKLFRYWNYAAALFLFFAKSNNVKAQGIMQRIESTTTKKAPELVRKNISKDESIQNNKTHLTGAVAKVNANVLLQKSEPDVLKSLQGKVGYVGINKTDTITPTYKQLDSVVVRADVQLAGRMIYTVAGGMTVRRKIKVNTIDTIKAFVNTVISPIKIYPDPIKRGETFTVSFPAKANNNYTIQILNTSGNIISLQQINAGGKTLTQQLQADLRWAAGTYFIRIFDDKNKLINKSSFIVH